MNEELSPLELWMPEIKKYIRQTPGLLLESQGFVYNRPDFSFKRKHKKNAEEFCFVFVNQFPISYRLNFLLQIWNHDVKTVKEAYPYKSSIENYKLRSLVFFMRDFMTESDYDPEFQDAGYNFLVLNNRDLFNAADTITRILQEQALPLCNQLSELGGLDRFFEDRPGWSVNSLNINNIITELIAARLNRKRNFPEVCQQTLAYIDKKIEACEMEKDTKTAAEQFCKFLHKF
ncbi:MAG TPA: hypothetical protein VMI35_10005 [Puia sp.]|nr:hypothetical protein [Puia sp.]